MQSHRAWTLPLHDRFPGLSRRKRADKQVVQWREYQTDVNAVEERLDQTKQEAGPGEPGESWQQFQPRFVHALVESEVVRHASHIRYDQKRTRCQSDNTPIELTHDDVLLAVVRLAQKRRRIYPAPARTCRG